MNKEELREQQKAAIAEYKNSIEAEPEVKKWIDHKKKIRWIGIIYLLIYFGFQVGAYRYMDSDFNMTRFLFKSMFSVAWFAFFMTPTANWKLCLMFYVSAIYNAMDIAKAYKNYNGFAVYFQNGPVWAIIFIMSVLIPILFLILACWLTIPEKNRALSDRAQELNKAYIENIKQLNK